MNDSHRTDQTGARGGITRRRALAGVGSTAVAFVAGCAGESGGGTPTPADSGSETPTSGGSDGGDATPTPYPERLPSPVRGNVDAPVTLAVFEDYACPHCADYNAEGYPDLAERYLQPGEIRYEHRDLPIPVADPGSWQAANAARAVQHRHGDDAFWAYAEALFEHSGEIPAEAPALFGTVADEQGYDGAAIREAAVARVYERTVRGDRQDGVELGVEATPSFVVNGEIVASGFGSGTVGEVARALDAALADSG